MPDHLLDSEVHLFVCWGLEPGCTDGRYQRVTDNDIEDLRIDLNDRGELVWYRRDTPWFQNMYFSAEMAQQVLEPFVLVASDYPLSPPKLNSTGWLAWAADDGTDRDIYLLEDALGSEPIQRISHPGYYDNGVLVSDDGYLAWTGSMSGNADAFRFPSTTPQDITPPVLSLPEDIYSNAASGPGDCGHITLGYIGKNDGCDCPPDGSISCDPDCTEYGNPGGNWCGCQYCWDHTGKSEVYYAVTATDDVDGTVPAWCYPRSGSWFELGQTTVDCDAEDSAGNEAFGSFNVFVVASQNEAPLIESFELVEVPTALGDPVTATVTFCDPDTSNGQTHIAEIDWGDGGEMSIVDTSLDPSLSLGPTESCNDLQQITVEQVYGATGVYTVSIMLADADGADDTAQFQYAVIYDPDGGFVTGGGWIDSPEGAYAPDPTLIGKANFGFVSKYQKGASVPTGNTEFQFKVADLNFKSTSYDWLVIAGDNARYKGEGTINGEGSYKFMLWGGDGTGTDGADTFRIRIWTEDEVTAVETDVYDNGFGQDLGGGSVVIHKAK